MLAALGRISDVPLCVSVRAPAKIRRLRMPALTVPKLVIVAAVNSAISAFYYLQLVAVPMLGQPNARTETVQAVPSAWPRLAAIVCGVGVILLPLGLDRLIRAASTSTEQLAQTPVTPTDDAQASATGAAR